MSNPLTDAPQRSTLPETGTLAPPDFEYLWRLPDDREVILRTARVDEADSVRQLYFDTYGDRYGLSEVIDPEKTLEVLTSPNWHWILAVCEGRIVGSLIFGLEPAHRLGKALAGVVHPDLRGHKVMRVMLEQGIELHLRDGGPMDLIYAVVRTFISLSLHYDLAELGFVDTGIFPNVRRVANYETHGLKVLLAAQGRTRRRQPVRLIPQLQTLYQIAASRLSLERPEIVQVRLPALPKTRLELFELTEAPAARRKLLHQTCRGQVFNFFPLHGPDMILTDATRQVKVFLSYQGKDGHATILGFNPGPYNHRTVLLSVADYCEKLDCVYLELLVSAYEPQLQAEAYQSGFLPCAYFPAAYRGPDGKREDYFITSKTFAALNFRGVKLTEESKPYLLEFFKVYTSSLWEDLMDA